MGRIELNLSRMNDTTLFVDERERMEFLKHLAGRVTCDELDQFMSAWGTHELCTPEMHDFYLASKAESR